MWSTLLGTLYWYWEGSSFAFTTASILFGMISQRFLWDYIDFIVSCSSCRSCCKSAVLPYIKGIQSIQIYTEVCWPNRHVYVATLKHYHVWNSRRFTWYSAAVLRATCSTLLHHFHQHGLLTRGRLGPWIHQILTTIFVHQMFQIKYSVSLYLMYYGMDEMFSCFCFQSSTFQWSEGTHVGLLQ